MRGGLINDASGFSYKIEIVLSTSLVHNFNSILDYYVLGGSSFSKILKWGAYYLKIYFIIYTVLFYNTPNILTFIFLFYSLK